MAEREPDKQDVNEMFLKMGEKLGWFQHKNIGATLKTLSNSTKKKSTKSRLAKPKQGEIRNPQNRTDADGGNQDNDALTANKPDKETDVRSKQKQQQRKLSKKPLSKSDKEQIVHPNPRTAKPKLRNFLDCFSDDSDTNIPTDAVCAKPSTCKQTLTVSSDSDSNNDDHRKGSHLKQALTVSSDADCALPKDKGQKKGSYLKQTLTLSSDSDECSGKTEAGFVSCIGESPLGNNSTIQTKPTSKTDGLSHDMADTRHNRLKLDSPDYNETVINSCVSAASFSFDLGSLGEPLVESTRIHRRSSVSYMNLIGSPEDDTKSGGSDSSGNVLYKTCIAEPETSENSYKQLNIPFPKAKTAVLNSSNSDDDLAINLNMLELSSKDGKAETEEVLSVDGDSYEVIDATTQTEKCDIGNEQSVNDKELELHVHVDENDVKCVSIPELEKSANDTNDHSVNDSKVKHSKYTAQLKHKSEEKHNGDCLPNCASDGSGVTSNSDHSDDTASEFEVIDVAIQTDNIMDDSSVKSPTNRSDGSDNVDSSLPSVKASLDGSDVADVTQAYYSCTPEKCSESDNDINIETHDSEPVPASFHEESSISEDHKSVLGETSESEGAFDSSKSDQEGQSSDVCTRSKTIDETTTEEDVDNIQEKADKSMDSDSNFDEPGMDKGEAPQQQWRSKTRYSSDSSSGEDDLQTFFQKMRVDGKKAPPKSESESLSGSQSSLDEFVVGDDVIISEGDSSDSSDDTDGSDDDSNYSAGSSSSDDDSSDDDGSADSNDTRPVEKRQTRLQAKGGNSGNVKLDSDGEDFTAEKYPRSVTKHKRKQTASARNRSLSFSFSSDDEDTSPPIHKSSKPVTSPTHKPSKPVDHNNLINSDSEDNSKLHTKKTSKEIERKKYSDKFSSDDENTLLPPSRKTSKQLPSKQKDCDLFSSDDENTLLPPSRKTSKQLPSKQKDCDLFSPDDEKALLLPTSKTSEQLHGRHNHIEGKTMSYDDNSSPRSTIKAAKTVSNSKRNETEKVSSDNTTSPIPTKTSSKTLAINTKMKSPGIKSKTESNRKSWSFSSDEENIPVPVKNIPTSKTATDKNIKNSEDSQSRSCFQSSDEDDTFKSSIFKTPKPWEQKRKTKSKPNTIKLSDSEDELPDIARPALKEKVGHVNKRSDSLPDELLFSKLPTPLPRGKLSKFSTPQPSRGRSVCSFLASLSAKMDESRRDATAARFVTNFKRLKDELSHHLFTLYNQTVFEGKLPTDTPVVWNKRLLKTAGYCYYKKGGAHSVNRTTRIELSTKVCDSAERTRDTLIHEMCHATVWLVNGVDKGGHGTFWQFWARQANHTHPELPVISRCHSYDINTKFTYKCTRCGYCIGRHSKSLDTEKKVCGYCHGTFELQYTGSTPGRGTSSSNPTTPRTPNRFALYVKEHYGMVKKRDKQLTHRDVMQELSKQFAEMKHS